jgi:hypothetical protein
MKTKLILLSTLFCANYVFAQNFDKTPYIKSDGVMEVGRYIDFHTANAGTTDYDVRIQSTESGLFNITSGLSVDGNATINNNLLVTNNGNSVLLFKNDQPAISFLPNNSTAIFHIANTLNEALQISNGSTVGEIPMATFKSTGEVGIGTTAPQAKLDVSNSGNSVLLLKNGKSAITFVPNDTMATFHIANTSDNKLQISNGSIVGETPMITIVNDGGSGLVGIGTTNPQYPLDVYGTIRAREVLVNLNGTADFVFKDNYKLKPIQEVYEYAKENKHLPEIPSEAEVVKNGMNMGEFQVKLLQKVEELTLYMAQQDKTIQAQQAKIKELEEKINK